MYFAHAPVEEDHKDFSVFLNDILLSALFLIDFDLQQSTWSGYINLNSFNFVFIVEHWTVTCSVRW